MLTNFDRSMQDAPPALITALCVAVIMALAFVDHVTGFELSFSIFYLMPISMAAWYIGGIAGLAMSVVCATSWLAVDLTGGHEYSSRLIPFWNAGVRLGFFVLVTSLLVSSKSSLERVADMARIDSLTGIMTRGAFRQAVTEIIRLAARSGQALVLAYVDLDDFKAINDTRGHAEGDRVLQAVASALTKNVRRTDLVGRLGGDEFAVLLPDTNEAGAREVLDKIRVHLAKTASDYSWPIGFSIGAAVFSVPPKNPEEAIAEADALMYRGKKAGKNLTVFLEVSQASEDRQSPPGTEGTTPGDDTTSRPS